MKERMRQVGSAEYSAIANSTIMWIACSLPILIMLFQCCLFFRKSKADALRLGLTRQQVNAAVRSAAVTAAGPCFVLMTAMLSLILYVGAPLAWLRVDFIGSIVYELQAASIAADSMGLQLGGSSPLTVDFLGAAAFVMTTGFAPLIVLTALYADKMDKLNALMAGGRAALVPIVGMGILIGVFISMTLDRVYPFNLEPVVAVIGGGVSMFFIQSYNNKANKQWIKEWKLTICMIIGMIAATISENFH
jgi:hypothetical protein